jgi:hypothetical protein
MRWLIGPFIWILATGPLLAQGTVIARVMDAHDQRSMPYATVLIHGTTNGTITNSEGWFRLPLQGAHDSLRISFIGYKTLIIPFTQALDGQHILMERAQFQLGEVVIRPGEDLYARLVAASNWLRRSPEVRTKLYYTLETHSEEQPVEMLESYFSATYKAAMLTDLDLKRGRIGIAPKEDRHFINFNTARAFSLMDIHARDGRYPISAFSYTSAKKLKAEFRVELISSGIGDGAVDHLRATPRNDALGAFVLDLWLAPGSVVVRAFELSCRDCTRHPFVPLFSHGRIDSIDMRYRQTWSTQPPLLPEVMELEYRTAYTGIGFSERFTTHAIMHAFDHGTPFIPTLFRWQPGLEEYRKIAWLPEDNGFWNRMSPPLPTEKQLRDQAFVAAHDLRKNAWYDRLGLHYDLLRPVYKAWSREDRLKFTDVTGSWSPKQWQPPAPNKVALHGQLYLEMDTSDGRFNWFSCAVFDHQNSVHMALELPWTEVFIRIFFDLCEVERLKMEARLKEPGMTVEKAHRIHDHQSRELRNLLDKYMKYTENGRNAIALLPWHELIAKQLGIHNITLELWPVEHMLDRPIPQVRQ